MILIDMTVTDFIFSALSGIAGNILFGLLLVWPIQQIRYWKNLKLKFHNKSFEAYRKRFPDEIVYVMKCQVKGNVIKFSNESKNMYGEFIINPFNLKTGEGFHYHNDSDGYGFSKVIIKDENTFLIDAPYIKVIEKDKHKVGSIVYQAFIWRKKTSSLVITPKSEIIEQLDIVQNQ